MKRLMILLGAVVALALQGCEGKIQARLDNGIGLTTYENLGLIEQKPMGVGLVLTEDVRSASLTVKAHPINYTISVGEALGARMMHALVLQFDRVRLLNEPVLPADGSLDTLMIVSLKGLDATVKHVPDIHTVATKSSGWIEVEAVLKDIQGQIVWVGTSRVETEASRDSIMVAGGQNAGAALNLAVEATVAKLVSQLAVSGSLREYLEARS